MYKVEKFKDLVNRVSKSDIYDYYVTGCNTQDNTRKYFNISRPNFSKLLDYYNIKKSQEEKTLTERKTKLLKHGDANYNNREKMLETMEANYGSVENAYKYINTLGKISKLNNHGDENFTNREKAKQTCLEKYGVPYGHMTEESIEKAKQTYFYKTGYYYAAQNPNVALKLSKSWQNKTKEEKDAIVAKCIKSRNSVSKEVLESRRIKRSEFCKLNYSKLSEEAKIIRNRKISEAQKRIQSSLSKEEKRLICLKRIDTMRKRNSFNTSNSEDVLYNKLLISSSFCDVVRQYKDDRYPFACDFYIPSKDLFIELNAHWTHGGRPFDPNDEDCKNKLNIWQEKAKTSKFYKNAIYTWTDLDVRKFNIAEQNNLNYICLYNKDDISKFLEED